MNSMIAQIAFWACVAVLSQCAEPIIMLKRHIGFKEEEYDSYSRHKRFFHRMLYCALCLGFWIALIGSGSIGIAAISSVLGALIYKNII